MKIKNIKSLVERLPEKRQPASHSYYPVNIGYNQAINKVSNTELPPCNEYVEVNEKKLMATLENIGTINKETHQLEFDLFELDMLKKAIQEAKLCDYKKGDK